MATYKKVSSATAQNAVAALDTSTDDVTLPEVSKAIVESLYPLQVTLRNNGGFSLSEPESGAYLPAGGSQVVTLTDEAHASRVMDNLRELAKLNSLGDALVAEGFPAELNQE